MNILNSGKLIPKKGFHQYVIDGDPLDLKMEFKEDCELFVRIQNGSRINVDVIVENGVHASVLFWNDAKDPVHSEESYEVKEYGDLTVSYGECNTAMTERNTKITLSGKEAHASLNSASLVKDRKEYRLIVENAGNRTFADIQNYAVVLKKGKLMIDAIGKIDRGAKKAQSHQTSRALAFEEGQNATILPELLIDENDVQASHAMSIGRVDENHLYYMMSRGLDMKQCTMLISQGYLLPVTDHISDDTLRETLREELERKIQESCLM